MKRIISLILSLALCLSFLPAAFPVQADTYGDLTYTVTDGQVTITGCDRSATGSLTIPDTIDGCPVTTIGASAFQKCEGLTNVTIPDGVTMIEKFAFSSCVGLARVTIPASVTSIGNRAFDSCNSLKEIYFLGNVPELYVDFSTELGVFNNVTATAYYHEGATGWDTLLPIWLTGIFGKITIQKLDHLCPEGYSYDGNHTCTADGTERAYCEVCEKMIFRTVEGTAAHRFAYTSNQDATCTADGTKTGVCRLCGKQDTVTDAGTALGHSYGDYLPYSGATCNQDSTLGATCVTCGHVDIVTQADTALGHAYSEYISNNDATCTQDGTKSSVCANCGDVVTVPDEGTALGHSFTNYVSDNNYTCTLDGTETAKCDRCDETDIRLDVGSAGHWFVYTSNNDGTCTTDGTKTGVCVLCDHQVTVTDAGSRRHRYEAVVTQPTATQGGYTTYTCTACGHSYVGDYTDPLDSTYTGSFVSCRDGEMTLELIRGGTVIQSITVAGTTGSYQFTDVQPGDYTLRASKPGHGTREYPVTVAPEVSGPEVELLLMGDATGDGVVNIADVAVAYAHAKGTAGLEDYALICTDTNGDGIVNVGDVAKLYAAIRGVEDL